MKKKYLYATAVLKSARESRGYTQQEMADLLSITIGSKVSLSAYQKWEQGVKAISQDKAVKISREVGRSVSILWEAK